MGRTAIPEETVRRVKRMLRSPGFTLVDIARQIGPSFKEKRVMEINGTGDSAIRKYTNLAKNEWTPGPKFEKD
ncbi:MAG: hypothetical protein A2846_04750 [Candidatus Doudnabacteria bacterium RIFCSPHIGHO2_01_FULL_49_9]|uniref:Uncharacterized protein n=1 Tax=Candidatus Doudnabacteria bacterium RIFCSPHIGHO2_01_FULL_49_9 TaxID=1817827 RepID=A0A1F5P1S7_9BACT|nr:MAG: hypothetical protein A2846_04750 [Candidatus Doudnabacteria bacterium RIFCSPHIGHO2_01_FULL_49_9]